MYRHLTTWRKLHDENHKLANAACDYVINLMLKNLDPEEKFISMPRKDGKLVGLLDDRFAGMNAKQVFDILKQEQKDSDGGDGDGDGDGDSSGDSGGFDEHDWEDAKGMSEEDKRQLEREIDQAVRQGVMAHQKLAGSGTGGMDRGIAELLEPKVDWREVLREFVKSTCNAKDASSWRRVNRRFLSSGVYMPSLIGEKVGHLVVAVDTSGSIGDHELAEFLSEVKGIAEEVNPEKVDLLYWGSSVVGHEEYEANNVSDIVTSTKPIGGGGTDPECVEQYLAEKNIKPECIVVLTDGYVPGWGTKWEAPLLWVIVGGNDVVAPNGKTIHVKE
jgi:predicted metal-dependent peptidase